MDKEIDKTEEVIENNPDTLEEPVIISEQGESVNNVLNFINPSTKFLNSVRASASTGSHLKSLPMTEDVTGFKSTSITIKGTNNKYHGFDYISVGDTKQKFASNNIPSLTGHGKPYIEKIDINVYQNSTVDKYVDAIFEQIVADRPIAYVYNAGVNGSRINLLTYRPTEDMTITSIKVLAESMYSSEWVSASSIQVNDIAKKLPVEVKANDRVKIVTSSTYYKMTAFITYKASSELFPVNLVIDTERVIVRNKTHKVQTQRKLEGPYECTFFTNRRISNRKDIKVEAHRGVLKNVRISFDSLRRIKVIRVNLSILTRKIAKDTVKSLNITRVLNNINFNVVDLLTYAGRILTTVEKGTDSTEYSFDYSKCGFRVLGITFSGSRSIMSKYNKIQINNNTYEIEKFSLKDTEYVANQPQDITTIINTVNVPNGSSNVIGSTDIKRLITDKPVECVYATGERITSIVYEAKKEMIIEKIYLLCSDYKTSYGSIPSSYMINNSEKTLPLILKSGDRLTIKTMSYHQSITAFIVNSNPIFLDLSFDTFREVVNEKVNKVGILRLVNKTVKAQINLNREIVKNYIDNVSSIRSLIKNQILILDTYRKVIFILKKLLRIDTIRNVVKQYSPKRDTLRKIYIDKNILLESLRKISLESCKTVNSYRKVIKGSIVKPSILRKVIKNKIILVDTIRIVACQVVSTIKIDTLRKITKKYNLDLELVRKIAKDYKLLKSSVRKVSKEYEIKIGTVREVSADSYTINRFNIERNVVTTEVIKANTLRSVIVPVDKYYNVERILIKHATNIFKVNTLRTVVKAKVAKYKMKRKVTQNYNNTSNFNRFIVKVETIKANLKRLTSNFFRYKFNTLRDVISLSSQIREFGTTRRIILPCEKIYNFNRITVVNDISIVNMVREVINTDNVEVQLERKIIKDNLLELMNTRKVVIIEKLYINVSRLTANFFRKKLNLERLIVNGIDKLSLTERKIITEYINNLDTHLKIISLNYSIFDLIRVMHNKQILKLNTMKKISSSVTKSIDTAKKVTNEYIYLLDTQREVDYELEKDIHIMRGLYNFYEVNYDTSRKVTVPINELRDTLYLDFELRHGALYKVNERFIDKSNFDE